MNSVKGIIENFWKEENEGTNLSSFSAKLESLINNIKEILAGETSLTHEYMPLHISITALCKIDALSEEYKKLNNNIRIEILTIIFAHKQYAEVIKHKKKLEEQIIEEHASYFEEIFNALGVENFLIWLDSTSIPNKLSISYEFIYFWIKNIQFISDVALRQQTLISRTEQLFTKGNRGLTSLDRIIAASTDKVRGVEFIWDSLIRLAQALSFRQEMLGLTTYFFKMLAENALLIENFMDLSKKDEEDEEDDFKTLITQSFIEGQSRTTILDSIILPALKDYAVKYQTDEKRRIWLKTMNWIYTHVPESFKKFIALIYEDSSISSRYWAELIFSPQRASLTLDALMELHNEKKSFDFIKKLDQMTPIKLEKVLSALTTMHNHRASADLPNLFEYLKHFITLNFRKINDYLCDYIKSPDSPPELEIIRKYAPELISNYEKAKEEHRSQIESVTFSAIQRQTFLGGSNNRNEGTIISKPTGDESSMSARNT